MIKLRILRGEIILNHHLGDFSVITGALKSERVRQESQNPRRRNVDKAEVRVILLLEERP